MNKDTNKDPLVQLKMSDGVTPCTVVNPASGCVLTPEYSHLDGDVLI